MTKDERIAFLENRVKELELELEEAHQNYFLIYQKQRREIEELKKQVKRYKGEVEELGRILDHLGWQ
jgi:prefoldin subunit 5